MARPGLREPLPVGGGRVIQRPALRRALGLTLLSTVIPGAGLLWTRHRRAGIALLLLVAATFGYIVFRVLSNGLVGTALSVGVSA